MESRKEFPSIGPRIRQLRLENGFSLRSLGLATGLSAAFLSQVENDLASPSIVSLHKIAAALEVPMFAFLDNGPQTEEIVRAGGRKRLSFNNPSLTYEILTTSVQHKVGAFLVRLKAGATHQAQPLISPSEEILYILQGEIEIQVGERVHRLGPGDSIFYESRQLKSYVSLGSEDVLILCAMAPPVL